MDLFVGFVPVANVVLCNSNNNSNKIYIVPVFSLGPQSEAQYFISSV